MPDYIVEMRVSHLKPNPINETIYDENIIALNELKQSIELNGLLEPLVIARSNMVISGHRRLEALKQIGFETCDCRISTYENDTIAMIELNRYRQKTTNEIVKEAEILKTEYKKLMKLGRPLKGEVRNGKSRTIVNVSQTLGVSTTKLKKLLSIKNYEPSLLRDIDLGLISVERAYQQVRTKYIIGKDDKTYSNKKFRNQFERLLKNYNPPIDLVYEIMVSHYPQKNR